jgi:hypothetical protein
LLLHFSVSHVVAHDAPADRAEHRVMTGIVAGDPADESALQAALGVSGRWDDHGYYRQTECYDSCWRKFHDLVPLLSGRQAKVGPPSGFYPVCSQGFSLPFCAPGALSDEQSIIAI